MEYKYPVEACTHASGIWEYELVSKSVRPGADNNQVLNVLLQVIDPVLTIRARCLDCGKVSETFRVKLNSEEMEIKRARAKRSLMKAPAEEVTE